MGEELRILRGVALSEPSPQIVRETGDTALFRQQSQVSLNGKFTSRSRSFEKSTTWSKPL